jgi:hypothetical protein
VSLGVVRSAGTLALAAVFAAAAPGSAEAGSSVKELRRAECPAPYLVNEPDLVFDEDDVRRSRDWKFTIARHIVRLKPRVNWNRDPINSKTFRAGIVGLNWMRVLFYDYRVNDNEGALRKARALALDFVRHQPLGGRRTNPEAWDSKTIGDRGAIIAYVVRAASCEGLISAKRARVLLGAVARHANWILRHQVNNNHGLFDAIGLAGMSRLTHFLPGGSKWRNTSRSRFERILRKRIKPEEGFWLEHSSSYQWEITRLLDRLLEILRISPDDLERILARMKENSGWLVEPDRKAVQFGDTQLRVAPDEYRDIAATQSGLFTLPRSGFAFVRSGDSYLAQIASFHNSTHKHSDELSVDLYDRGHRILADTGFFHKDPGRWFRFTRSASAHTTVTVRGQTFKRGNKFSYGSGIDASGSGGSITGGTWYAIRGSNPLLRRQRVRHQRWLLYKPQVALIVVDRLRSRRSHTYRSFYQLGPDLTATEQAGGVALGASGFSGVLTSTGDGGTGIDVLRASRRPLQGWTSPHFRVKEPRPTVIVNSKGRDVDRVTTLRLTGSAPTASAVGKVGEKDLTVELSGAGGIRLERVDLRIRGKSIDVSSGP